MIFQLKIFVVLKQNIYAWLDANQKELLDHIGTTKELPADEDFASCN